MPFVSGMNGSARRSRGFTLIEVLFGLLILGLVMTTSLAVFYERENTIRSAEEAILAWQAIANEAELLRFEPWGSLGEGELGAFRGDLRILGGLENPETIIEVADGGPGIKELTLRVEWGDGRSASATVLRTDTGGTNLW